MPQRPTISQADLLNELELLALKGTVTVVLTNGEHADLRISSIDYEGSKGNITRECLETEDTLVIQEIINAVNLLIKHKVL